MIKPLDWQGTPAFLMENDKLAVTICPAIGSNVYSLWDKTLQRELLRVPPSPDELRAQPVQYGTPVLMPPNRIREGKFRFEGRDYTFDRNHPTGNHIHGMLRTQEWQVKEMGEADGKHFITTTFLLADDPDIMRQYPHALELTLTYELEGSTLTHRLRVTNNGEETAPFGYGLHTWFMLDGEPDRWKLQLGADGVWELDESNVPTGVIGPLGRYEALLEGDSLSGHNMDTVFQIGDRPRAAVLSRDDVTIRYSASELFKHWVIYTKGEAEEFICLEPYTWVTDAPNLDLPPEVTGLRGIGPGQTEELEVTLEIEYPPSE